MSLESSFRALLTGDATVAGLVSTRIYPSTYPQSATDPCVRYQKVAGAPGLHMQGSDGLAGETVQVDIRALTAASALSVRDAIVAKLHGFKGTQGDVVFQLIGLDNDRGLEFESTGTKNYYTCSLDFTVWSRAA